MFTCIGNVHRDNEKFEIFLANERDKSSYFFKKVSSNCYTKIEELDLPKTLQSLSVDCQCQLFKQAYLRLIKIGEGKEKLSFCLKLLGGGMDIIAAIQHNPNITNLEIERLICLNNVPPNTFSAVKVNNRSHSFFTIVKSARVITLMPGLYLARDFATLFRNFFLGCQGTCNNETPVINFLLRGDDNIEGRNIINQVYSEQRKIYVYLSDDHLDIDVEFDQCLGMRGICTIF